MSALVPEDSCVLGAAMEGLVLMPAARLTQSAPLSCTPGSAALAMVELVVVVEGAAEACGPWAGLRAPMPLAAACWAEELAKGEAAVEGASNAASGSLAAGAWLGAALLLVMGWACITRAMW
jgi:hypothetical protein